jgi:hypothetical protein
MQARCWQIEDQEITRAGVFPHLGDELGCSGRDIDPERIYWLHHPPWMLHNAARSFFGAPLFHEHPEEGECPAVLGEVGTDIAYSGGALRGTVIIRSRRAIRLIRAGVNQLSPGYAFKFAMAPGVFQHVHYDGIMLDWRAEHLALVDRSRTGCVINPSDVRPIPSIERQRTDLKLPGQLQLPGQLKLTPREQARHAAGA